MCLGFEMNGMIGAGHGRGMASVNQTRSRCINQMGKTHSKPLAARQGRGTAWARHAMCELALRGASRLSAFAKGAAAVIKNKKTEKNSLTSEFVI
jgi:hypothetical protein